MLEISVRDNVRDKSGRPTVSDDNQLNVLLEIEENLYFSITTLSTNNEICRGADMKLQKRPNYIHIKLKLRGPALKNELNEENMSAMILKNAVSKGQESDRNITYMQDSEENSVNSNEKNLYEEAFTILPKVPRLVAVSEIPVHKYGPNIKSPGIEITGIKFGLSKDLPTSYKHKL
ncbi:unnamed protein product [Diabrotica balteata]|uniref:Uncharacterized protein n=1 Tax=Diabrotica balteata TaxID=107213 RepID=A0A9N9XCG3_DIABA|nr:unnamed protein product [Diabrotica balteata]